MPGPDGKLPAGASLFETVADYERKIIIEALEECGYSQTEAATQLKIPLSTLNQKIKRLGIETRRRANVPRGAAVGFGDAPAEFTTGK